MNKSKFPFEIIKSCKAWEDYSDESRHEPKEFAFATSLHGNAIERKKQLENIKIVQRKVELLGILKFINPNHPLVIETNHIMDKVEFTGKLNDLSDNYEIKILLKTNPERALTKIFKDLGKNKKIILQARIDQETHKEIRVSSYIRFASFLTDKDTVVKQN